MQTQIEELTKNYNAIMSFEKTILKIHKFKSKIEHQEKQSHSF